MASFSLLLLFKNDLPVIIFVRVMFIVNARDSQIVLGFSFVRWVNCLVYGFSWYFFKLFLFIIGNYKLLLRDIFNKDGILSQNTKSGNYKLFCVNMGF